MLQRRCPEQLWSSPLSEPWSCRIHQEATAAPAVSAEDTAAPEKAGAEAVGRTLQNALAVRQSPMMAKSATGRYGPAPFSPG